MIHGQLIWRELLATVVAGPLLDFVFPPGGSFEFPRFFPFFPDTPVGVGIGVDFKIRFVRHETFARVSRRGAF